MQKKKIMRLKQYAFLLLITLYGPFLLGEENNKSKNLNYINNFQNTLNNENLGNIKIHVVKKGDTLSSISKKYKIKKELLIEINKLPNENYIYIGQNLKIVENLVPEDNNKVYYHEIKKGENLTEIANKYNLSLSKLIEINSIVNQDILKVGTKLKIKEEISENKDSLLNAPTDQIEIYNQTKRYNYGPLVIKSYRTNKESEKILEVTHKNGKNFILHIKCDKKEINVRGIGRKWKGWMPAKEKFEEELLNDFCLEFD